MLQQMMWKQHKKAISAYFENTSVVLCAILYPCDDLYAASGLDSIEERTDQRGSVDMLRC